MFVFGKKPDTTYANRWYNYLCGYGPKPNVSEYVPQYPVAPYPQPYKRDNYWDEWDLRRQNRVLDDIAKALDAVHPQREIDCEM